MYKKQLPLPSNFNSFKTGTIIFVRREFLIYVYMLNEAELTSYRDISNSAEQNNHNLGGKSSNLYQFRKL